MQRCTIGSRHRITCGLQMIGWRSRFGATPDAPAQRSVRPPAACFVIPDSVSHMPPLRRERRPELARAAHLSVRTPQTEARGDIVCGSQ